MTFNPKINLSFSYADFSEPYHQKMFIELINHSRLDLTGISKPMSEETQTRLINGMKKNKSGFVLFAIINNQIVGMVICFVNFSTFKAKPYLNIQDFIIFKEFRGIGIGKELMRRCIYIARKRDYCKITLEVRDDNLLAMKFYKNLDFEENIPVMHFWTKSL
jgi:ribosomal protein S18 acetylase RimI-like enzyme